MAIFEPLRRGAEEFIDTLGEGWDWLRERSSSALTRFRPSRGEKDAVRSAPWHRDSWGLLASDIAETDDEVIVRVEAPGLEEKDFSVSVVSQELVVRGEKRHEHEEKNAHYHLFETAYGSFKRRFALPCAVAVDAAKAEYRNGVLTVRLPRTEQARRRNIHVKSADAA